MDHGQCITEETLTEYLEGGLDPALKAASEVHLIACDDCRLRLAFFMRVLKEEVTVEESSTLQVIANHWDNKSDRMQRGGRAWTRWALPLVAVAAGLVITLISIGFMADRVAEPRAASEVVQLLLARHRPFESRLADEPHLPIVRTRGQDEPDVAYDLLAAEMTRLSADSHQMGRFYLLQKDFVRGLRYLEMAEREVGSAPEVHNDLGVAYLESGTVSGTDKAAAEFRHALEMDPAFLAPSFNLAMLYERKGEKENAEAQWKRYLELDSKSQWAVEAQSRLHGLNR